MQNFSQEVTQKTRRKFSFLAHDQVHEQLNEIVKGDGGIIGITENEAALTRWTVSGSETARLLMEYVENHSLKRKATDNHHEQIPSVQKTFITPINMVKNVTDIIEELDNSFTDTSCDLFALDSKQIMSNSVVDAIKSAEDIGKAKYHTFLQERLYNNTIDFNDTMSKTICLCYVLIHKRKLQSTLPISPI